MKKFMVRYKENRLKYGKRIDDIPINLDSVADIELYESIEKRGFRVLLFGVDITKQELVSYAIRQMKNKDTHDWNIIEAPSTKERIKLMK